MISVVTADLGAAGSGVEADLSLRVLGESDLKPFYYLSKSVCVSLCFVGITAVDLAPLCSSVRNVPAFFIALNQPPIFILLSELYHPDSLLIQARRRK